MKETQKERSGAKRAVRRDPDAPIDTPTTSADEPPTPVVNTPDPPIEPPKKSKELAKVKQPQPNTSRNSSRGTATASEPQILD
jgi:hypothetical protein